MSEEKSKTLLFSYSHGSFKTVVTVQLVKDEECRKEFGAVSKRRGTADGFRLELENNREIPGKSGSRCFQLELPQSLPKTCSSELRNI